ncbi:deaminase [Arthrobacter sp. UCD-GKA]|uniref:dihydrofolate reductase family protein n=1 Tax=Arthrobacter sp. UCD-GKA TaxID=1913576 RepID=UPI0008DD0233|nr:dihydrofolate reductase family protein [Arthrobacter sp. UCD-GKA]OIH82300.1 deaminase [Arthrobacter sp. UCD-GKA]
MAKLIYAYLASLDGYVADTTGDFGWAYPGEEVMDFINAKERDVGTYLYGRTMYEMMAGWETDPGYAAGSPGDAEFARLWQAADKVVFSRTLEAASTKRTRIERSFDAGSVRALKESAAKDLNVSGATIAAEAWRAGLIDECQVYVAPMLVGGGKPMFPDGIRQPLELLEERRFANGMVFMRHRVLH